MSSSEFEPRRLAPWTDTQAASPIAISPVTDGFVVAVPHRPRLAVEVGRDPAHVVVDGRQHWDGLPRHVHAGEDLRRLADPGQALVEQGGAEVLEVEQDVVPVRPAAAPLVDLDRHGPAHDVAAGEVLGRGRVALHEAFALRVREVAALAARSFRDEAARAVDAGRVELGELHVLERQAGAQRHGVAVARAGVGGRAGEVDATVAARGQDRAMRAEAVQPAVLEAPGQHAAAGAVVVHQQVERDVLDEELRPVPEALLVERVEDGVTGAVRGRAGALRHRSSP